MPNYDLRCASCKAEFSARASIAERESGSIKCPECASNKLEPVFKQLMYSVGSAGKAECPNFASCGASCPHALSR